MRWMAVWYSRSRLPAIRQTVPAGLPRG